MINNVEQYLAELKKELSGSDRATIQDALSDAEEYLRTAMSSKSSNITEAEELASVIKKYGTPAEVAAAYKQIEFHTPPAFVTQPNIETKTVLPLKTAPKNKRPVYARFFGVFGEPAAWGALFYLLLAMVTGIIYFTWVVTGISISFSLIILIIGLPITGLFLLSVRGIALVEGRLVEALLGVRMPRRVPYAVKNSSVWQRLKNMISDKHTWFSMVYMLMLMPLGIFYFSVLITLIAISLECIFWPVISLTLGWPFFTISATEYFATGWLIPIGIVAGLLLLTATMHLVKVMGKGHGVLAKAMLVRP